MSDSNNDRQDETLTGFQKLALVKGHTGLDIRLKQFEEVIKVSMTDNIANVLVTTYDIRETTRELIFRRCGTKLISWVRDQHSGKWRCMGGLEVVLWDETFVPRHIIKSGRSHVFDDL